jgi:hypothetical protein
LGETMIDEAAIEAAGGLTQSRLGRLLGTVSFLVGISSAGAIKKAHKAFVGRRLQSGYPQINARVWLYIPSTPAAGSTLTLNGTAITLVSSGATGNQVNISGTAPVLQNTLLALAAFINASADAQISKFYAISSYHGLWLYARQPGSVGNGLTIATTISGAALDNPVTVGGYTGELPTVTLSQTSTSSIPNARTISATQTDSFRAIGAGIVLKGGGFSSPPTYAPTNAGDAWEVIIDTDAPVLELRTWAQNTGIMVFVDDIQVQDYAPVLTGNASICLLKLDFAGVRRFRRIRFVGANFYFAGIIVGPRDTVYQPKDLLPLLVVMGTSYEAGVGSATGLTPMAHLARRLGCRLYTNGISSSGWNTASPNTPAERVTNYILNLTPPSHMGAAPEIGAMVWWLGINDTGGDMTAALVKAKAAVDGIKAALPNLPQVFVACDTPQGQTSGSANVNTMLAAAAAYAGAPLLDNTVVTATNESFLTKEDGVHPAGPWTAQVRGEAIAEEFLAAFG